MDESTKLADLLELNLHECEEEVKNIVDKAVKEMSMERYMRELNVTWSKMEFEQEIHVRTGATLIRASEELIETLEENQARVTLLLFKTISLKGTLSNFEKFFFSGSITKSDYIQVHCAFLRRGFSLAKKVKHRGSSNHSLVRSSTNLDAFRKYLYVLRGHSSSIAYRC